MSGEAQILFGQRLDDEVDVERLLVQLSDAGRGNVVDEGRTDVADQGVLPGARGTRDYPELT